LAIGDLESKVSESGWLSLATLIIGAFNGFFLLWVKYKTGQQLDQNKAVTDHIVVQNHEQTNKLAEVHADINGRVAQLIDSKVHEHIGAAVAMAVANALKEEREIQAAKTKEDAAKLIELAKQAAAELKEEDKN